MKICVAQTRPAKGDIQSNIDRHLELITSAASYNADLIIFPELSLTGYEPALAAQLACNADEPRLDVFQKISDRKNISVGVGMPLKNNGGVSIGLIIFQPGMSRQVYYKKYLHSDEEPFFVPGDNLSFFKVNGTKIALAICYELSIDAHTASAFANNEGIYIASVAKSTNGIDRALLRLSDTAKKYSSLVFMSNCVGPCDGEMAAGKTSVWDTKGTLLYQLHGDREGLIVFDTNTKTAVSV